mmetsp:Transcript_14492/g.31438  ORF Transcript_14492/g.31438 Transcript_14492/m.31438 type:complete len:375 (+) Transcript_14492:167-1291(+)
MNMKSSLLALQITLFHHPGANAALFVQKNNALATRPCRHDARRYKKEGSSSLMAKSSEAAASSSSSADLIELLPVIRQRHPLFQETNAVSKPMPVPHPELWRQSLPSEPEHPHRNGKENASFWDFLSPPNEHEEQHRGHILLNDVHVQFDNPAIGARQLLEQSRLILSSDQGDETASPFLPLPETIMAETETIQHLTSVLSYFQTVAAPLHGPKNVNCIARVVSTVGSVGTKCPRWHADHVPVRLIMSILGPGCEYIPENVANDDCPMIVNRNALNNLDEDDTLKANDIIVPPELLSDAKTSLNGDETVIKHAKEGEAILLMGRGWEDATALPREENSGTESNSDKVLAAVHRSPTLLPDQERILLTVDLVDWD